MSNLSNKGYLIDLGAFSNVSVRVPDRQKSNGSGKRQSTKEIAVLFDDLGFETAHNVGSALYDFSYSQLKSKDRFGKLDEGAFNLAVGSAAINLQGALKTRSFRGYGCSLRDIRNNVYSVSLVDWRSGNLDFIEKALENSIRDEYGLSDDSDIAREKAAELVDRIKAKNLLAPSVSVALEG